MALLIELEILAAEWKRTKSTRRQKSLEAQMQAIRAKILRRA